MRIFLTTLALSIGGTIVLWNFGLARLIWPAHPALATTLIIGAAAIALQFVLSDHAPKKNSKAIPTNRS